MGKEVVKVLLPLPAQLQEAALHGGRETAGLRLAHVTVSR